MEKSRQRGDLNDSSFDLTNNGDDEALGGEHLFEALSDALDSHLTEDWCFQDMFPPVDNARSSSDGATNVNSDSGHGKDLHPPLKDQGFWHIETFKNCVRPAPTKKTNAPS